MTNSTIYNNGVGMLLYGGGVIESYGNNRVLGNTFGSTFSGTVVRFYTVVNILVT